MPGLWEILLLLGVAFFIFGARKPEDIARISGRMFKMFQELKGKVGFLGRFFRK